jgi:DNA-binding response OmpR family regulator
LRAAGYRVLQAADFGAALAMFQQHAGEVDMLVTDLALPGKNGYELGLVLVEIQPALKLLYTSAQSGGELHRFYGMTASGDHFLEKPFQTADLVHRVRLLFGPNETKVTSAGGGG